MKIVTKFILLTFVLLFSISSGNAQSKWGTKKAKQETEKLTTALELDEEMSAKVNEIYVASYTKMQEINDGEGTEDEKKTSRKKLWEDNTKQLKAAFGKELTEKYDAYRKKLWASKKKK